MSIHICWQPKRAREGELWQCQQCGQRWQRRDKVWKLVE